MPEEIYNATARKIAWYADCINRGDDAETVIRTALRDILKDLVASEHKERIRRINAEVMLKEAFDE